MQLVSRANRYKFILLLVILVFCTAFISVLREQGAHIRKHLLVDQMLLVRSCKHLEYMVGLYISAHSYLISFLIAASEPNNLFHIVLLVIKRCLYSLFFLEEMLVGANP